MLLAGYLVARTVLGALLNPPLNGPDEGGHVEYVRSLVASGGRHVSGAEARQPPTYYFVAALPWQAAAGTASHTQLFWTRLAGIVGGLLTLVCAWAGAQALWPERPTRRLAVASIAALAPGYLYLLSSVNNDPLAAGLASVAVVAAIRLWKGETRRRWTLTWVAASAAAPATKLTAAPVVVAMAAALCWRYRTALLRPRWTRAAGMVVAFATVGGYLFLLSRHPTTSAAAAAAHFAPPAVVRAPFAYLSQRGFAESFRTFWYAYDYAVTWPPAVEGALAGSAALLCLLAVLGLIFERPPLPGLVWAATGVQVALVLARYGLADVLHVSLAGAAQAKSFFPAIVPASLLLVGGMAAALRRLWGARERWMGLAVFVWLVALDAVSLTLLVWHHYRWWTALP